MTSQNTTLDAAAGLFKSLSSATRLALLVELIEHGEADVTTLATTTGIAQPLASQHLRTLRMSGLVTVRRDSRHAYYSLQDDHVAHIVRDALAHAVEAIGAPGDC